MKEIRSNQWEGKFCGHCGAGKTSPQKDAQKSKGGFKWMLSQVDEIVRQACRVLNACKIRLMAGQTPWLGSRSIVIEPPKHLGVICFEKTWRSNFGQWLPLACRWMAQGKKIHLQHIHHQHEKLAFFHRVHADARCLQQRFRLQRRNRHTCR
jgi:hypothetical protein